MHHIIAIGIFQAIVAAVLLWKGKVRTSADTLLIMFIACIACHLSIKFVIYTFVSDEQVRQQMNTFIGFCYAPLLYLYARKVNDETFIPATCWYVFLPFFVAAIVYFTTAGVIMFSGTSGYRLLKWYNLGSYCGILLSDIGYATLAIRIMRGFGKEKVVEKRIVLAIAWCFLGMVCISGPVYFINTFFEANLMIPVRIITYTALSGLCVMIIYYKFVAGSTLDAALRILEAPAKHSDLAVVLTEQDISHQTVPLETPEVHGSISEVTMSRRVTLPEEKQREIWESLESQMRQSLFFTDCDLNLDKLASLTGINKYHLSETLNSFARKSFYQYINEYRIAYALKEMESISASQSEDFNFLSLAFKSGFKAKSSFNRYFKEITGFTPSEHLRTLRQPKIAI
ncbi:AraC family transcriptional regulator [Dyadobacter sp. LJ53]|uniref:helix-turn-helix domain-containing protein n=1 Tax=Dyadobacter chenwenxiniae TaxID=2906456 RepID=UPI001F4557AD|nr:AraC family transcriptional regulator [Dyadobacter chenwenxiniae]MCF0049043.1 AraC family transcriptional regulator [Dyadobacter chenwenxiniae]